MIDRIGDDRGRIGANVDEFLAQGYVADRWKEIFRDVMIEAGHAAIHRRYRPTKDQLQALMDLTEWLVASIYIHPEKAKEVKAKLPSRNRPKTR